MRTLNDNLLLMTDSYKVSHYRQYPAGTEKVYSYLEFRRGGEYSEAVFFGLQYFLMRYLAGVQVTTEKIERAARKLALHFGDEGLFNRKGWEHVRDDHGGCLPLEIRAVPEGTVVPEGNVLLTIENTCPRCYWLTNYVETLLVEVWYPSTTATISREMKRTIRAAFVRSGTDTKENLMFRLHDFGFRGVSSPESAALGGAGHLVNFYGTDTLAACDLLDLYYDCEMAGFSIPAAEHSTITSWGEDGEEAAYANMLKQFPTGLVAVVSDSWDIRNAAREIWGNRLKAQVLERDGVLVVRPDSGDPKVILPELLDILGSTIGSGSLRNDKGYRLLHPKIRVIQGDGITRRSVEGILDAVMDHGWSADTLSFGSGGGLLQDCNRDTQRAAFKASQVVVAGVSRDVFKRPATDPSKDSKRGRLMLVRDDMFIATHGHPYATLPAGTPGFTDLLVPVFRNGEVLVRYRLDDIRVRAELV